MTPNFFAENPPYYRKKSLQTPPESPTTVDFAGYRDPPAYGEFTDRPDLPLHNGLGGCPAVRHTHGTADEEQV